MTTIKNYKGYQLHISDVEVNPNGQKTQTVLIYKGVEFVGAVIADLQFEDAIVKAENKVNSLKS